MLFVFTALNFKGGIPRFNQNVIDAAIESGHQVDLLVLNDSERISDYTNSITNYHIFSKNKFRFVFVLLRILFSSKYKQIFIGHINLSPLVFIKYFSPLNFFSKGYIFAHGIEIWGRLNFVKKISLKSIYRYLAVSSYTAESIILQMGESHRHKTVIFPNTIPKRWYLNEKHDDISPTELKLPKHYILTVSRLDRTERKKGIDDLIKSMNKVCSEYSLVIVGKGNDIAYLKNVALDSKVLDRVYFYENVSDDLLKKLYESALCFALPSDKEGFGIVYLEAMYYGIPAIGAKSKGILDVIDSNVDGLLVEYGDVESISHSINQLIKNDEMRNEFISNGYKKVMSDGEFSYTKFSQRLFHILNS